MPGSILRAIVISTVTSALVVGRTSARPAAGNVRHIATKSPSPVGVDTLRDTDIDGLFGTDPFDKAGFFQRLVIPEADLVPKVRIGGGATSDLFNLATYATGQMPTESRPDV